VVLLIIVAFSLFSLEITYIYLAFVVGVDGIFMGCCKLK
jgi:coenzyme F420-reducing hydrogenase delta subunit